MRSSFVRRRLCGHGKTYVRSCEPVMNNVKKRMSVHSHTIVGTHLTPISQIRLRSACRCTLKTMAHVSDGRVQTTKIRLMMILSIMGSIVRVDWLFLIMK